MTQVYRSPRSRSAAAATAPARLAQEVGGDALWRTRPDGQLEVAVLRDRSVERYLVDDEGRTTLLAVSPPTWSESRARLVLVGAWLLMLAAITVAGVMDPDGSSPNAAPIVVFLMAFVLFGIGGFANARADDLRSRLKKLKEDPAEWYQPTNLHEWLPRNAEQLAAVEHIADEHEGLAFVRDIGARTIDVVALRSGRLERYWVDDLGQAQLADAQPPRAAYFVDRALNKISLGLFFAFIVVGFAVDHNKGETLIGIGAGFVAVILAGWLNGRRDRIEEQLERVGPNGHPWIEIRTRVEEDDGG